MQWEIDFGDRDWHPWFAWYPVRLDFEENHKQAWLEVIERKKENCQGWICCRYRSLRKNDVQMQK